MTTPGTCGLLSQRECVPCRGGVPPLTGQALDDLHAELGNGWNLVEGHHLEKNFKFPNFRTALEFTNVIGGIAEGHNHHPDILLSWGRVRVTLWTHKVDGLTEADFVFAAKVEQAHGDAA